MALLTFGEGYHNFHHFFQADYRNGIKWFQFDPTKWFITFLAWVKLADKLKITPNFKIMSAKLQMKLKQAKIRYSLDEEKYGELESIKDKIVETLKSIEDLKTQYSEARLMLSQLNSLELKRRIEIAKVEFKYNLNAFNLMLNNRALA
jgi:stearoyl-CoA desaturase (delta-9 desaturase)